MSILHKEEKKVQQKMVDYVRMVDSCIESFKISIMHFFENGHGQAFEESVVKTHECESRSDDLRREIELTLYGKSLLPESRGDILGLLETADRIPNQAESVLSTIDDQKIDVPARFIPAFIRLVMVNLQAYTLVRRALFLLFTKPKETLELSRQVDRAESESDREQRKLIRDIFSSELDTGSKILLRDLVSKIGAISDRCENLADRVAVATIKRRI